MGNKRKLTPRQRVALAYPVVDNRDLHPRFYRVTAPFQSILTFDIQTPPDDYELEGLEKMDNQVGIWHGRVGKFPWQPLDQWTPKECARARQMVQRLIAGVGREAHQVRDSKDGSAIRGFRWGTTSELAMALRARGGKDRRR